jgi:hypothetical protein
MLLQTITGSETFGSTSAKAHLFHVPTTQIPGTGREVHLAVIAKAGISGWLRVGQAQTFPIAPGYRMELGMWTRATYEVPEGAILKLYAQRNIGFGAQRVQASMMIRIRSTAALRRVSAILTGNPAASISRANFEGRFDIYTLDQALALGLSIPVHFQTAFSAREVARGFEVVELEVATAAPVVHQARQVENALGEQVVVPMARRGRILGI